MPQKRQRVIAELTEDGFEVISRLSELTGVSRGMWVKTIVAEMTPTLRQLADFVESQRKDPSAGIQVLDAWVTGVQRDALDLSRVMERVVVASEGELDGKRS